MGLRLVIKKFKMANKMATRDDLTDNNCYRTNLYFKVQLKCFYVNLKDV